MCKRGAGLYPVPAQEGVPMKAEYEFLEYIDKIKIELMDLARISKGEGFTNVQISIDEKGDINVWGKEPAKGFISACHNIYVRDGKAYQYTVSQYDERIGDWV